MNKTKRYYLFALAELTVLVLLDQLSKYAAVLYLKNQSGIILIPGIFELYYLENRGAAWGLLENATFPYLVAKYLLFLLILLKSQP